MAGPYSKFWCYTINNPTDEEQEKNRALHEAIDDVAHYVCSWEHFGEGEGTPHLQGYVAFERKKRVTWLRANISNRGHYERRMGSDKDAWNYCLKGPYIEEHHWPLDYEPEGVAAGRRSDITDIKDAMKAGQALEDIIDEHPGALRIISGLQRYEELLDVPRSEPPDVVYIWGPTGTGKTASVVRWCEQNGLPLYPQTDGEKWWNGYRPRLHRAVLIDEFVGNYTPEFLNRLLDRYPMRVEKKGGVMQWRPEQIIICSNYSLLDVAQMKHWTPTQLATVSRRINKVIKTPDELGPDVVYYDCINKVDMIKDAQGRVVPREEVVLESQ